MRDDFEDEEEGGSLIIQPDEGTKLRKEQLLKMDEKSIMLRARKAMLVFLLDAVENGTAMPADMTNLRALLKDNGMILGDPLSDSNGAVIDAKPANLPQLPSYGTPEYEE